MNQDSPKRTAPLITGVSQFEVDFVVPRVGTDLPLGIDPFLLYKSRDVVLRSLHTQMVDHFNRGLTLIHKGQRQKVLDLFSFPEVSEIGMGYARKGKKGSGVGRFLSELITETLAESPALLKRGIHHVEEMQLISLGIGPDRVSDIAANLIKEYLVRYTQKQCEIWKIPLHRGVPLANVFQSDSQEWIDGYFDLPLSPFDGTPILLVPRRIVRTLPWINYEDFFRMEFSSYLRAKRVRGRLRQEGLTSVATTSEKQTVVSVARVEVERIARYISSKEAAAEQAQPSASYLDPNATCPESEALKHRLQVLSPGVEHASEYQRLVLEILNFLFSPELIDGELEVRTVDGTERRDIIFTNDSDQSFWDYVRNEHSALLVMFETKNVSDVTNIHLNQTATYLGDRIGRLGFVITRNPAREPALKKAYSVFNDSTPRKVILILSDQDLNQMLDLKCQGRDPMRYVQSFYRAFRTSVQ
jgi:hypothetical protein